MELLVTEPWRFGFFQAVRVVEQYAAERMLRDETPAMHVVGYDDPPVQELLRFRVLPSHSFPVGELAGVRSLGDEASDAASPRFEMVVTFFGLTGPHGVLPHHYTQLLIDRIRQSDHALRDFLDLFHHRLLSLYHRAWKKYRFDIGYEQKAWQVRGRERQGPVRDESRLPLFDRCLLSLVGLGTGGLSRRLDVHDEVLLYYAGLFAQRPPNASALARMLADYLGWPVEVQQFQGQWLYLEPADQTAMASRAEPQGLNARLGVDTIVGERVWSVQDKFRLRLGPVPYALFCRFMPNGDLLRPLAQLTRTFVGPEFDFDVQPVLSAPDVPATQLETDAATPPRLGWNTWLLSRPAAGDRQDAVFYQSGDPCRR